MSLIVVAVKSTRQHTYSAGKHRNPSTFEDNRVVRVSRSVGRRLSSDQLPWCGYRSCAVNYALYPKCAHLLSFVEIKLSLTVLIEGMDLNPLFTGATAFRPAGEGGELKLFEHVGIKLVHGWLVDPASPEASVMCKVEDYDSAVNLIVDADHTSKGRLVVSDDAIEAGPSSPTTNWTEEERIKIEDGELQGSRTQILRTNQYFGVLLAIVVRRFLDTTWSQLTYHGLFELATTLEPGSLVALFRSSHLSVLYKSLGDEAALYTLVTDHSFLNEPSVVWEKLEDVDGGGSTFVDSDFVPSSPAGGDFAGQTAEDALRAAEDEAAQFAVVDPAE